MDVDEETPRSLSSMSVCAIQPREIPIGARKNCEIVYHCSPLSFTLQLVDNEEFIASMDKLSFFYEKHGQVLEPSEIVPGRVCVAQWSRDLWWYRAEVLDVVDSEGVAHVRYVDYGNYEFVSFSKIREIEPEFLKLPGEALHCQLEGAKSSWSKEESSAFFDELGGKNLEVEFIGKNEEKYVVRVREIKQDYSLMDCIDRLAMI